MGEGRRAHAPLGAPCPAIEDPASAAIRTYCQLKLVVRLFQCARPNRTAVSQQRRGASDAPLQQILQPSAKEELFRNGDEEKREDECAESRQRCGHAAWKCKKPEAQTQRDGDRRVKAELAQPDADVAETSVANQIRRRPVAARREIRRCPHPAAASCRMPSGAARPRRLKPAQIDGQAEHRQNQKIAPVAACRKSRRFVPAQAEARSATGSNA